MSYNVLTTAEQANQKSHMNSTMIKEETEKTIIDRYDELDKNYPEILKITMDQITEAVSSGKFECILDKTAFYDEESLDFMIPADAERSEKYRKYYWRVPYEIQDYLRDRLMERGFYVNTSFNHVISVYNESANFEQRYIVTGIRIEWDDYCVQYVKEMKQEKSGKYAVKPAPQHAEKPASRKWWQIWKEE